MIRIVIVDDHELLRDGFKRLINTQTDMQFTAGTASSEELFTIIENEKIDIIVLDISLSGKNGLDVLKDIKIKKPGISVLVLSMHAEEHYALRAIKDGASGYVTKGTDSREILEAIRKISTGGIYVSPSLGEHLARSIGGESIKNPHEKLSDREFQILCLIGEGKSSRNISEALNISENTVRTYRSRIIEKMDLKSTAEMIQYVIQYNLIE